MAISIATDLIAGVLAAAEPRRATEAAARFGPPGDPAFDNILQAAAAPGSASSDDMIAGVMAAADPARAALAQGRLSTPDADTPEAYRKFEAFLLGSVFEAVLPDADSGVFGDGYAGGIWRSMAAQQFGTLVAEHGGVGASRLLAQQHAQELGGVTRSGQWPYFAVETIGTFRG